MDIVQRPHVMLTFYRSPGVLVGLFFYVLSGSRQLFAAYDGSLFDQSDCRGNSSRLTGTHVAMVLIPLNLATLIADVIDRMPRSDPEALALRIIGTLDQAGYEIRRKPGEPEMVGFAN